jgi:hypothetical protein
MLELAEGFPEVLPIAEVFREGREVQVRVSYPVLQGADIV